MMMHRNHLISVVCLCLSACADNSEKYRDTKHLELPPTLAIEHTASKVVEADEPVVKPKASATSASVSESSAKAELSKLVMLTGSDAKPGLQMKTRFERAWELVDDGLRQAEIEVVDRNREQGVFRVRYVANGQGSGRGLMGSITSFFSDKFEDTEYTLTLDKDKKITEARVEKVVQAKPEGGGDNQAFNNDDSASLMKLLHKTILENLAK